MHKKLLVSSSDALGSQVFYDNPFGTSSLPGTGGWAVKSNPIFFFDIS